MSALLEKWRELMRQPDSPSSGGIAGDPVETDEGVPGDNIETIARMGDPAFGYESNWTEMLGEEPPPMDVESTKKVDIAATKITAQELCHMLSPGLCQCPENPLKCHAVRVYMRPALKVVQALRKSNMLR